MTNLGNTHSVDACVGKNLRKTRKEKGLSQHKVAEIVGLTFQQIQKYEKGLNRISCSKLWEFAQIFGVPVSYFFQGIGKIENKYGFPQDDNSQSESIAQDSGDEKITCPVTLHANILEYLEKIDNMRVKKGILSFVKTMYNDC